MLSPFFLRHVATSSVVLPVSYTHLDVYKRQHIVLPSHYPPAPGFLQTIPASYSCFGLYQYNNEDMRKILNTVHIYIKSSMWKQRLICWSHCSRNSHIELGLVGANIGRQSLAESVRRRPLWLSINFSVENLLSQICFQKLTSLSAKNFAYLEIVHQVAV